MKNIKLKKIKKTKKQLKFIKSLGRHNLLLLYKNINFRLLFTEIFKIMNNRQKLLDINKNGFLK